MTRIDELKKDIASCETMIISLASYLSAVAVAGIKHDVPSDFATGIESTIRERIEMCNTVLKDYQCEIDMIEKGEITDNIVTFDELDAELGETVNEIETKLKLSDNMIEVPVEENTNDHLVDVNDDTILRDGVEIDASVMKVIEYHENRKEGTPLKIGDIFYSSWGYEQTNIDWYEVVEITKSGKSVKIREIATKSCYNAGTMTAKNYPDPGNFKGEVKTKRIKDAGISGDFWLNMSSYESAWMWDGKMKSSSHYA